jgi:hypothetical protein
MDSETLEAHRIYKFYPMNILSIMIVYCWRACLSDLRGGPASPGPLFLNLGSSAG